MNHYNNNPRIRVYLLNWNGGEDIKDCIDSLRLNKYENFSITIIDNNSSDSSLMNLPDDIDVIPLDENHGFSAGYNIGIKKSILDDDEYIVILNYDTIVENNFIDSIANEISNAESDNYIYGTKILYHHNPDIVWYAGGKVQLEKGIILHNGIRSQSEKYTQSSLTGYITGCCMIMHKDIFSKLNGFDNRFFMYNEDVDFCLRAAKMGIKCKFLPKPVVFHKVSLSVGGNYSFKKILMKIKSGYQLYRKYYPFHKAVVFASRYFVKTILKTGNDKN